MKLILLLFTILLYGCGSVPKDKTPAPFDNNLYTQELQSCDKTDVGLLTCTYKQDAIGELVIPTLFSGEYDIRSSRCAFGKSGRFEKSQPIKITYKELLQFKPSTQTTCIFDVKVFMDKMDRGMRAIFLLSDMEEFEPLSVTFLGQDYDDGTGYHQLRRNHSRELEFVIRTQVPGTVIMEGCGIYDEFDINFIKAVPIKQAISPERTGCVLRFGLVPFDDSEPLRLHTFLYENFSTDIIRLAGPNVDIRRGYYRITMAREVAFAAMGGVNKVFKGTRVKKLKVKYVQGREYILRMGTANGRYAIYGIKDGVVTWKTSIKY
jgi:uncharacterized protein YceK